jgi:poly(3-hydroxybutyrate) depolymerase
MRVLSFVLLAALLARADGKAGSKDQELRRAIAAGLADLASWCPAKALTDEGRALAEEALSLDAANAKAKEAKEKCAGASAGTEADRKEYEGKLAGYGKKLAPLYRELGLQKHDKKDDAAYDGFLVRAFELDAKLGPAIDAEWRGAQGKRDWERAHRIASGMERTASDPARVKALKDIELKVAERSPVLKGVSGHEFRYYMMLPKDWTPAKKWPVVVYVEGAGSNFLGGINNYASNRGELNCIVVTPQSISSTNDLPSQKAKYAYPAALLERYNGDAVGRLKFDEEGLLLALADLRKDYGAEEKIFITGFSGGGNLTWRMVFGHPDLLWGAAPACPNFANPLELSAAPERENLPVKVFQGDKDEYLKSMLEAQWEGAKKICDEKGWKNVSRTMLPGVGHSACVAEVMAFFRGIPRK